MNMECSNLFLSNHLEELYQLFKYALIKNHAGVFKKKLVIIPGKATKQWLMFRLAEDPEVGIAAGLDFATPFEATSKIGHFFQITELFSKDLIKFQFQIESQLKQLALEMKWDHLSHYLLVNGEIKYNRLIETSKRLAHLFTTCEHHTPHVLKRWEQGAPKHWEEEIWKRVVGRAPLIPSIPSAPSIEFFVFGFSYINPYHHAFFEACALNHPLNYYLLSPCAHFWGDLLSDREAINLRKQWGETHTDLDHFLFDRNALLANFGRAGKEMTNRIVETNPHFHLCHKNNPNKKLLHLVQNDLLMLSKSEKALIDSSIEIRGAHSLKHEVEIVYNQVIQFLLDHKVHPKDLIVLAPDITRYAPFIEQVFGHANSQLAFEIFDLPLSYHNESVQAFLYLLHLEEERLSARSVVDFFSFSPIAKTLNLGHEELALFKRWVEQQKIWWGASVKDRKTSLSHHHGREISLATNESGTWENAIKETFLTFALSEQNTSFGIKEWEWFGEVLHLFRKLHIFLEKIRIETRTIAEWTSLLFEQFETFFMLNEESEKIHVILSQFAQMDLPEKYPFASFKTRLKETLESERAESLVKNLNAVQFATLQPMRTLPASMIILMGMNEGHYPRTKHAPKVEEEWMITQGDSDRMLFLDLLISARDKILYTYQSRSPEEANVLPPSLLVSELSQFLLNTYDVDLSKTPEALISYLPYEELKPHIILSSNNIFEFKPSSTFKTEATSYSLEVLNKFAKNPIREYFKETLGMYSDQKRVLPDREPFQLERFEYTLMRQNRLFMRKATRPMPIPPGSFGELARIRLQNLLKQDTFFLNSIGITHEMIVEKELTPSQSLPIKGSLKGVTEKGLIVWSADTLSHQLAIWPTLLVWQILMKEKKIESANMLFSIKEQKQISLTIDNPYDRLKSFLNYYEQAKHTFSPLIPDWIPLIAVGEQEKLQKELEAIYQGSIKNFYYDELVWSLKKEKLFSGQSIIEKWQPTAVKLFGGLE